MRAVRKVSIRAGLVTGLLMSAVAPASATLFVTPGPGGMGNNVIANACASTGSPSLLVNGCLNTNHALDVFFQGTESLTISGGQATIGPADGSNLINDQKWGFDSVKIYLEGGLVFSKIILNVEVFDPTDLNFSDNWGDTSGPFSMSGNGNGDFTITSSHGYLSWIQVTSGDRHVVYDKKTGAYVTDGDIKDIKQVRFNGVRQPCTGDCGPPPSVPEPATLFLLGSALLGFGATRRKQTV